MGWISIRRQSGGARCGSLSCKQTRMCVYVECRGGVAEGEELGSNPKRFFLLFFFLILYHVLCINQLRGTKTMCSASYGKEKTPSPIFLQPGTWETAVNPCLSGTRPMPHQPQKIRYPPPTKQSKSQRQINAWGGINRKTLAVDTNKVHN